MLFVLLFDFSPLSMYLFFNWGDREAHFQAFSPFKASSDWKDSKIWKAVKTPQLPMNDGNTKNLKAVEVEVVFLQI